jgi:type I restriction enzyme M protein
MANNDIQNKLWSACNKMRQDPGTTGALQYIEQFSWLLFLKVYEEIENEYEAKAAFEGKTYIRNINNEFRWSVWTGKDSYITGPDLLEFVQTKLFPYLKNLSGNRTKEIISEIFNNTQNRMEDGYLLREVVDIMAGVDFFGDEDSFAVSSIYEGLFSRMKASDIKPLAEFHTPRVIARFMTEMVAPKIGQTIYDPCNGPSGFLTEAYHFMRPQEKSTKDKEILQKETFYGKELKSLPFILGTMNMMLNGIATPNIRKMNTLSINLFNLTEKYDVILTNPPFSGTVRGIESNFPYPSAQTEILFLQHCLRSLKDGGKCAIIFPEGVLFKTDDQSYVNTKKELLQQFNLHHIVRLPNGSFAPYTGIPTNILFFDKTGPTKEIFYWEMPLPEGLKNFSKSKPIKSEYFEEAKKIWQTKELTEQSWIVPVEEIIKNNFNLDVKNPNKKAEFEHLPPEELIEIIENKEKELVKKLESIKKTFNGEKKEKFFTEKIGKFLTPRNEVPDMNALSKGEYNVINKISFASGLIEIRDNNNTRTGMILIEPGDLVISGINAGKGAIAIYDENNSKKATATIHYSSYKVDKNIANIKYLWLFFRSEVFREILRISLPNGIKTELRSNKFVSLEIPLPSLPKQNYYVELFEEIEKLAEDLEKSKGALLNIMPSVLSKAFNGEL